MGRGGLPQLGVQLGSSLTPAELPRFAAHCEEVGFRQIWIAEDYFAYGGIAAAATVLAATEQASVGIGVLASVVRHPAVAAMEFAQLAQAFPGRVIAGIGHGVPGWMRQMGLKQRSPLAALGECVTAVRALLEGDTLTAAGDYFTFDEVRLRHAPVEPVLLFTGVQGARSLELSGRIADGTLLGWFSSPAYVRWAIERIEAGGIRGESRDHTVATLAVTSIDRNGSAARNRITGFVSEQVSAMASSPQVAATKRSGHHPTGDHLDVYAVAGDPERCIAAVARLFEAGSDQVVFVTSPGGLVDGATMLRQIDLLAESVLPAFAGSGLDES